MKHMTATARAMTDADLERIAGAGYLIADVSPDEVMVAERRYASRVLDELPVVVSGQPGQAILLEVANVDQLQLERGSRTINAVVVLIRAPFRWRQESALGHRDWPMLMIVGYANSPAEFDASMPDFERFLGNIRFEGQR